MITPEQINRLVHKWWPDLLKSEVLGEAFFPRTIDRIGKIQPGDITDRFGSLQHEVEQLFRSSKNETGRGYRVNIASRTFRRTGTHSLPESIVFETVEDYVFFVRKEKEWKLFKKNLARITEVFPSLKPWIAENAITLTFPGVDWTGILETCRYFLTHPRPDLYIRQLPLQVHTKFLEENEALLRSLLDFLIPGHIRYPERRKLAERFYLRYDEPLIRIRILDERLVPELSFKDLSIPLSHFRQSDWLAESVVITENKMNFLTLPALPYALAIWSGGGFNVGYLKDIPWLKQKKIYYWGDLDEHGFQILHQLRTLYSHAVSVMMDKGTFEAFQEFVVRGPHNPSENLSSLTREEADLYQYLKSLDSGNRLEQEKISQAYAEQTLFSLFDHFSR